MKNLCVARLCTGVSLSLMAVPAHAADADTSLNMGDIVVTARAMAGNTAPATSIDRLGGDAAQRAVIGYGWELVGQMPGVLVTNFNQGTTSGKISLRGFNGEGEVNAVKLLIDGVPANSNDGNMPFIDMVFPLDIAGVEVVRGTSDARYGLHNIAGNVNILTRTGGRYAEARLGAGSFGTYEAQFAAGHESGALSQNYSANYRQGQGYRAHSDYDRLSLSGKWVYTLSDAARMGLVLRHYEADAEEPGYLTVADAAQSPRMTNAYNATDGDQRRVQQASLHVDADLGADVGVSAKLYANRLRDDRYVRFSAGAAQQRRFADEDHWGAMAAAHWHVDVAAMPVMIEAGGDFQHQANISERYTTQDRQVIRKTRDQQFTLDVGGVYLQAAFEPLPWLRVTPAYRLDWVGGRFQNRLAQTTAPINDYGTIGQPKLSIAATPVPDVTLYGSWGRTFQIGVGSGAYLIPPRQTDLAPSRNTGWEAGIKLAKASWGEARLALWQQSATGEIKRKLNDPLGDFDNLGATRRRGVDAQMILRPVAGLSVRGAIAWQKAEIVRPDPATPHFLGKQVDHVPRWLISGGVDYQITPALRLSVSGSGQSAYYLTSANAEGRWGDAAVLNADLGWQITPALTWSVTVKNLANHRSAYVWWDGAQALVSPADGRSLTTTLRVRL